MLTASSISAALTATMTLSTWRARCSTRQSAAPPIATPSINSIDNSASIASALKRAQPIDLDRAEFAIDVIDRDPHHEDADKRVEQHAQFDQQRRPDHSDHPEHKDAVLEHQVADDLHQRVAPADDQEEADRDQEDRRVEHRKRRLAQRRFHLGGEPDGQAQSQNSEQDRRHKTDKGLDFAARVGACPQPQQQEGKDDPFQNNVAGGQETGAPAKPALMQDQRHKPEQDSLKRQPADAGADPARAEQRKTAKKAERGYGLEKREHSRSDQDQDKADRRQCRRP